MPSTTKLSVSVPTALLKRADRFLTRPGEGRSAPVTHVLNEAVRAAEEAEIDAEYERAYRNHPNSVEHRRLLNAFTDVALHGLAKRLAKEHG